MFNNDGKCPDESLKRPSGCKVAKTCSPKEKEKDIENTDRQTTDGAQNPPK